MTTEQEKVSAGPEPANESPPEADAGLVKPEQRAALDEIAAQLGGLSNFNPNDPVAVAERNAVCGRAIRLLTDQHSGKLAALICEADDKNTEQFRKLDEQYVPYEPPDEDPQTAAELVARLRDMDQHSWLNQMDTGKQREDQDVAFFRKGIEAMTPDEQERFMQGHHVLVLGSPGLNEQEIAKWRKDSPGRIFGNFDVVQIAITTHGFGGDFRYVYDQTLIGHHGTFEDVHAAIRRAVEKLNDHRLEWFAEHCEPDREAICIAGSGVRIIAHVSRDVEPDLITDLKTLVKQYQQSDPEALIATVRTDVLAKMQAERDAEKDAAGPEPDESESASQSEPPVEPSPRSQAAAVHDHRGT